MELRKRYPNCLPALMKYALVVLSRTQVVVSAFLIQFYFLSRLLIGWNLHRLFDTDLNSIFHKFYIVAVLPAAFVKNRVYYFLILRILYMVKDVIYIIWYMLYRLLSRYTEVECYMKSVLHLSKCKLLLFTE